MNISKSVKFFTKFTAAAVSAAMLCGCGTNGGKDKMPPDDTPWNHDAFAIMETENGYYSNDEQTLCLRYYEKSTGAEIFLCAKPECRHNGNDYCTATYRYLETTNTLMYDGATVGFALYRTAADGSSIDRVGEVFKAKNPAEKEYNAGSDGFIIHRGYAYIPYFLAVGSGTVNSFAGSGLIKMNIRTGACEQLFSGKGYFSSYPQKLKGCGDYVYFDMGGDDAESGCDRAGTYRYNTVNGSISLAVKKEEFAYAAAVTEDILYYTEPSENYTLNIAMYDAESLEYLGLAAETDVKNFAAEVIAYDGMLIVPYAYELLLKYDKKTAEQAWLYILTAVIASVSGVFAYDRQNNMQGAIRSAKRGRGVCSAAKTGSVLLICIFTCLTIHAVQLVLIGEMLGYNDLTAPVQSLEFMRDFGLYVPIYGYFVIVFLARAAIACAAGFVCSAVSGFCPDNCSAMGASAFAIFAAAVLLRM